MSDIKFLPYYPKYIYLDGMLQKGIPGKLRIFLDFKNCLQMIYSEEGANQLVNNSRRWRYIDPSIFSDFLEFVAFHKTYAKKRGVDLEIYTFMESGESLYHSQIDKGYKGSRRKATVCGLDEATTDLYFKILNKNYDLTIRIGNKLPNVKVIRLNFLEADFMPYYLINSLLKDSHEWTNVIYSTDKDMYQCLLEPNIFQYVRTWRSGKVLSRDDVMEHFLKEPNDIHPLEFPLVLSIIGDDGDDVPGIKNVGPARLIASFDEIRGIFGPMKDIYSKLKDGEDLFDDSIRTNNKYVQSILDAERNEKRITKNLKLVSYYMINDYFENAPNTEVRKKLRRVEETILRPEIVLKTGTVLLDALNKIGISIPLSDETIYTLFE